MARPEKPVRGRAPLARDSQQWMLDYLSQETDKVFYFQGEGRGRLPRSVHSHDMISVLVLGDTVQHLSEGLQRHPSPHTLLASLEHPQEA